MLKKIIIAIGTGYALKIVQTLCGLVTVPILIGDKGLGLAGYGQLAVILSLSALMSMLFDGFRLSASKFIGKNKANLYEQVCKALQIFLLLTLLMASFIILLSRPLLLLFGLDNQPAVIIYCIAVYFIFEQLLYVAEQYYHAQLKTFVVNVLNAIEIICRLIFIINIFNGYGGTNLCYLLILLGTHVAKFFLYFMLIFYLNSKKYVYFLRIEEIKIFIKESIPLSLRGIANFLVFRMSIVYANNVLSAEAAAVFSIIFVTLRGYINQIFVNVIRPMVIPVTSGMNFLNMNNDKIFKYNIIISFYEFLIISAIAVIACFSPLWLPYWLGDSFKQYQGVCALAVGVMSAEAAFSLKSLILVSQGFGGKVARYSIFACMLYLLLLYFFKCLNTVFLHWIIMAIIFYILLYNGFSISYLFNKLYRCQWRSFLMILFVTIILSVNYVLFSVEEKAFAILLTTLSSSALILLGLTSIAWSFLRYVSATFGKLVK